VLNNWISGEELVQLLGRIRREPLFRKKIARRLRLTAGGRVRASWAHTEAPPSGWWDIPGVQARQNQMVSGDPALPYQEYIARKYGPALKPARGLSLGCGTGGKEILWARTGLFSALDAYDISEKRINAAQASVRGIREGEILRFHAADISRLSLPKNSYDIVLFDHSLHHFSPLAPLLERMENVLTPKGLLIANEFVGPSRFQWTERQLSEVNALLETFPDENAALFGCTGRRPRAIRPSRLAMFLADPSEAAESAKILPLLRKRFEVVEEKGYGGALLHLLFSGIAHHFVGPDGHAQQLLETAFAAEDRLMEAHVLEHDFALVVCRRR
jgi:SAM-dependent methyltransferase